MELEAEALQIAARGWPVFPCHPETKQPLTKGRDGKGGLHLATVEEEQIRRWWGLHPKAMIGFPTGARSGVFVLDLDAGVDDKTGEIFELEDLVRAIETELGEALPETLTVKTPRGGAHLYFRMPDGVAIGNRANVVTRVDVRGEGGYVIAPPSMRADGKTYELINRVSPAKASEALVRLVTEKRREPPHSLHDGLPSKEERKSGDERVDEAREKYALAALVKQRRKVATAAKGARNQALNDAALSLGHLVGAGALSERVVRGELEAAAAESGLAKDDGFRAVRATIDSGLAAGMAEPADLSRIGVRTRRSYAGARSSAPPLEVNGKPSSRAGAEPPLDPPGGERGDVLNRELAHLARTDLGNAARFVKRFGAEFLWCPVIGWLAWDGRRWARDNAEGQVAKAVHETVRLISHEARAISGTPDDPIVDYRRMAPVHLSEKLHAWALTSQGAPHLACIAKLGAPYLEIDSAALDADPLKINVANGTLVAGRSGGEAEAILFRPHDRRDFMTKITDVAYDPQATCPVYDRVLEDVQPDAHARRSLHQYGGYALTGDISEQLLAFWWGTGKNGKSTVIDVWCHVAGDYADTIPIESFLDQGRSRRGGEATPDLAILPGVRMLRTSEPERGAKLAESLVKLMTGGEPMMVRHLNRDPFKFVPAFKAIVSGNYKPEIHGTDEGIWRRVKLVPWTVTIPEEKRDRELPGKLRAEASGILNRLLDGLRDYLDNGFVWADAIARATEDYRSDSDPAGRFLIACTSPAKGARVQSSELYKVFKAWAAAVGERIWSSQGFGRAMRERLKTVKSDVVWYVDLALVRDVSDFVDQDGNPIRHHDPWSLPA